jgi:hypothetical protein
VFLTNDHIPNSPQTLGFWFLGLDYMMTMVVILAKGRYWFAVSCPRIAIFIPQNVCEPIFGVLYAIVRVLGA